MRPDAMGTITWMAENGEYQLTDELIEIEFNGKKSRHSMLQTWPVRSPRPVVEKLRADYPLLTGQVCLCLCVIKQLIKITNMLYIFFVVE